MPAKADRDHPCRSAPPDRHPERRATIHPESYMDIRVLMNEMTERGASDLYLLVDSPPVMRIEGTNYAVPGPPCSPPTWRHWRTR